MRLALLSNASYVPPRGGSTRSNLVWMDLLAERHECLIVCAAPERRTEQEITRYRRELEDQQLEEPVEQGDGSLLARRGSIVIHEVPDLVMRTQQVARLLEEFRPDWVLVSSEDLSHMLLRTAHRVAAGRIVYVAHTPQFFPFGKESWHRNAEGASIVREAASVVAISKHVAAYIERELGRKAEVVHPPIYDEASHGLLGKRGGLIGMVNPCAVKGLLVFLDLARALPGRQFAVIPGWGTTSADRAALQALPNVSILPNTRTVDEFLERFALLLMPSLWMEGFGLIAMEAMLRGVPVLASNYGGLVDAKAGVPYLLPVHPIERYEDRFDERHMPVPVIPEQDLAPWLTAIEEVLSSNERYEDLARASKQAAEAFVASIDAGSLERLLLSLEPAAAARKADSNLTPEKRALLLKRLQAQRGKP